MKQVDMSSKAVTRRLRQASQLRDLSLSLMKAKKEHDQKLAAERGEEQQVDDQPDPKSPTENDR